MPASDTLTLDPTTATFLDPYLPISTPSSPHPFTTLTYATSLDSHLSLSPGVQTHLSGPLSKSLTHYLRSKHTAILIGVSTAIADDPGLNCRLSGITQLEQPRPIIIDPYFRWEVTSDSRVLKAAAQGNGKAPFILVIDSPRLGHQSEKKKIDLVNNAGGCVYMLPPPSVGNRWEWNELLKFIKSECKVDSLMIEGGGEIINSLLSPENQRLINSIIVTIAPVYLGKGGVNVSPAIQTGESGQKISAAKFKHVQWNVLGNDVVMAARPDL